MARFVFRFLIVLSLLLAATACPASETDPARLLEKFEKLGFPAATNVRYIAIDRWNNLSANGLFGYEMKSGNAWLLSETPASNGLPAKIRILTLAGGEFELSVTGDRPDRNEESFLPMTREWAPAEMTQDVRRAVWLLNAMNAGKLEFRYEWDETAPLLFFFALALQQRGDPASARQIMAALRSAEKDWAVLIKKAENTLADQLCRSLFLRFAASGNWIRFQNDLKNLTYRFPEWEARAAADKLLERIPSRIRGETVSPAAFSDKGKELAAGLLETDHLVKASRYSSGRTLWLVPDSWVGTRPPGDDPDLRIRALGATAIPFLITLSDDGALTRIPLIRERFDSLRISEEGDDFLQSSLPRPMTRGEAALAILREMVPVSREDAQNTPSFIEACRAFYLTIKDRSDDEIAALFLREDSYDTPRDAAFAYLMKQAATRRVPVLENYLLNGTEKKESYSYEPDILDRVPELVQYGSLRGKEAEPLARKMADLLEREAETYKKPENVSFGDEGGNRRHVEETRKKLRDKAADLRLKVWDFDNDRLLDAWLAEGSDILELRVKAMPLPDALRLLLDRAARETNAENRIELAGLVADILKDDTPAAIVSAPGLAGFWKELLSDSRTVREHQVCDSYLALLERPREESSGRGSRRYAFYEDASEPACSLNQGFAGFKAIGLIHLYGDEIRAVLRSRAEARLAGEPEERLPPIPSSAGVDEGGRKALAGRLAAAGSRSDAEALVKSLGLAEREALPVVLTNAPALNRALLAHALIVTNIAAGGDAAFAEAARPWLNRAADEKLVRLLEAYCADQCRTGRSVTVTLARAADFGGCTVSSTPFADVSPDDRDRKKGPPRIVGYSGLAVISGFYGSLDRRLLAKPKKEEWGAFETSLPDEKKDFDNAVTNEFFSALAPASAGGLVVFQTQWRSE